MTIHLVLKMSDYRKSTETHESSLPFILTALMLNVMSCMLFKVVFLQVKQEQGKSKGGGIPHVYFF